MSTMAIILTFGIIAGFGLLIYGVFFLKSAVVSEPAVPPDDIERIKMSVEEADTTLSNINSVSSLIIEEIDIKYKELLFLYQMLEEKKKELLEHTTENTHAQPSSDGAYYEGSYGGLESSDFDETTFDANIKIMEISKKMDEVRRFPKLNNKSEILELHSKGYDITEIAKELDIGKGEVKLVLGLSKVGAEYE